MRPDVDYPEKYCLDCGKNTFKAEEYYMIHNHLWRRANPKVRGMLCLDCLEKRLGRELRPADFTDAPVNEMQAKLCHALEIRLYGVGRANIACSGLAPTAAQVWTGEAGASR